MAVYNIITDFGSFGTINDGTTDATPAFIAAGNALAGTSGNELYLPAGMYKWISNTAVSGRSLTGPTFVFEGIPQILIRGDGSGSTTINMNSKGNQLAAHGQKQNGNSFGKIASVSAGATSVFLLTPSDHSKFSVNQYIYLSGLNIQDPYKDPSIPFGYGYPANHHYFEYLKISSINTTTGEITFTTPLVNSYDANWPLINVGNNFEVTAGGCAALYSLPLTWDADIEYRGITFADSISGAQLYNGCRKITYRDCVFPNLPHPIPSQNQYWSAYNCTNDGTITEVDKCISNMIMDGCNWGTLRFQSSSIGNVSLTNSTFRGIDGLGNKNYIDNCTITPNNLSVGAIAYGGTAELDISNTSISALTYGGYTHGGPVSSGYSDYARMIDGVIYHPMGVSTVNNITDNGSGKSRFTVFNSGSCHVGQKVEMTYAVQEISTTASTASGTNVFTFAAVPAWIVAGIKVRGQDNGYNGIPSGATVSSVTSTTVTISANTTSTIASGFKVAFECPTFSGLATVLAVPNSTTVDLDVNFPTGFVYTYGIAMYGGSARYAIPGRTVFLSGTGVGIAKPVKIQSVTADTNFTYVQTDQTGGWPLSQTPNLGAVNLLVPGATRVRGSNLSGASDHALQLSWPGAYDKPPGSYYKYTYNALNKTSIQMYGHLVRITIDVTKAYTGSLTNLYIHNSLFDNTPVNKDGTQVGLGWAVDARTVGTRIILPTNTASNPTKRPNDGPLTIASWSNIYWVGGTFGYHLSTSLGSAAAVNSTVAAEDPSVWPEMTLEIVTDQGTASASVFPLFGNLRLHA